MIRIALRSPLEDMLATSPPSHRPILPLLLFGVTEIAPEILSDSDALAPMTNEVPTQVNSLQ